MTLKRNPVPKGELPITRAHLTFARGNKAVGFIRIKADDFLVLTTKTNEGIELIKRQAKSHYQYLYWSLKDIQPPMLKIERKTGQILGHEGRHRAAAGLAIRSDVEMWVAIILADEDGRAEYYDEPSLGSKVYLGAKDIPQSLTGEFRPVFRKISVKRFIRLWPK